VSASVFQKLEGATKTAASASSDFDLNSEVALDPTRKLRPAAVAILVQDHPIGPRILLTQRPSYMKHHPGQISFPGGKADPTDRDLNHTALREAEEEVGLIDSQVVSIGVLKPHETVTQFQVHPHIFRVQKTFDPTPNPQEVAEAFWVPFSLVTDTSKFQIQSRQWRGQKRFYYTVPFGPYYIWGATARILFALAKSLDDVR